MQLANANKDLYRLAILVLVIIVGISVRADEKSLHPQVAVESPAQSSVQYVPNELALGFVGTFIAEKVVLEYRTGRISSAELTWAGENNPQHPDYSGSVALSGALASSRDPNRSN